MGAPTGLVCDLCAVASLRDPSLTLEDDATGHGEGFSRNECGDGVGLEGDLL